MRKPKRIIVTTKVIRHHPELSRLVTIPIADRVARVRWEALTKAQQRMFREEIFAAKSSATRARRAERLLSWFFWV
jgi:hypothetical protein